MATGRIGVTPNLRTRWSKAPAGGTTSLSGLDDNSVSLVYDAGFEAVYRNGVLLSRGNDYTATNGTTITLVDATIAGDIIEVFANQAIPLTSTYTQAVADGKFINNTLVDAKGDIVTATADNTPARLAVGSNDQVLTADSSTATGLKWAAGLPSQTGNSGKYLTTNGTTASWGTVNQPLNWTNRLAVGASNRFNDIAYNGTNLYVVVGDSGMLYTSSDGQTWTSRTSGFGTNNILAIGFGNGLWVAGGVNGTITTSTDGITWTARTSNMGTNEIKAVTYANSIWVAVGDGGGTTNTGGLTYSTDGITWTRKSQSITVGTAYYQAAWNGTNWIIGTNLSTNNFLYASTPSGTWTAGLLGSGGSNSGVLSVGTNTILYNTSGSNWIYSTSPTLATSQSQSATYTKNNGTSSRAIGFVYNSKLYYANDIYMWELTPSSSVAYPEQSAPILIPDTRSSTGSPYTSSFDACIFVGAAGYIVGGRFSRVYTSF